jgi:uncharacterized membrane protein YkvA (DUF1232 family)
VTESRNASTPNEAPSKKAVPAKKATTTTASTKKAAPAKKPATNKAATKKAAAPAKKAATKKAAAPAKKAATKKAAPAKKAASTAAATKEKTSRLAAARKLAKSAPSSKYFENARVRARKMLDDPEELTRVADESYKSGAARSGRFDAVMDDFRTLVRLVVAYGRGHYREIPADSLVLVVAGLVYVVSPVDLIPDGLPVVGFIDDVVVVRWVIKAVNQELDAFRAWELGQ